MRTLVVLCTLVAYVAGDCFMHNPRGSNNRLNENSANRRNGNRAFDSQNNNRGGYNVGDRTTAKAANEAGQYQMTYFASPAASATATATEKKASYLTVEWTNQHGCGGNEDTDPNKLNCNMVIQYLCRPDNIAAAEKVRDGRTTQTPTFQANNRGDAETEAQFNARKAAGINGQDKVLQEPFEWHDKCRQQERNKGLFTADQKVQNNKGATATRQNANGNRRGYECAEERDYYPYWHPTDWKDVAILAENQTMCKYYDEHNFNTNKKFACVENFAGTTKPRHWSKHNNKAACEAANGQWLEFTNYLEKDATKTTEATCVAAGNTWGRPMNSKTMALECLVPLAKPICRASEWSRVNHLGNGKEAEPLNYTWALPHFPSGQDQRCVLRIRYNISTDDYDPWHTDSKSNQNNAAGVQSPVQNNPTVEIGANNIPLRLALNTAQFGRTFQDRSHMFYIKKRPAGTDTKNIFNLNVRGKRGNIVQTFPAVEYDFVPTNLKVKDDDLIHYQWTGSNSHNNGNPAGDGQAGDAGEGTGGTDRSNVMEIPNRNTNYPLPFENANMFKGAKVYWAAESCNNKALTETDIQLQMGSSGYFGAVSGCGQKGLDTRAAMNNQLNNVSPSFAGMLMTMAKGEHHYMCSRNNNFTNRSQKGTITVAETDTAAQNDEPQTNAQNDYYDAL